MTLRRLRILMLGWVNSPHVESLAMAMRQRGHEVHVAGTAHPELPTSMLPDAGVPTTVFPISLEIPVPGARALGHALGHVRSIRALVRDVRPHVVHAHYLPLFPFLAVVAGARPLIASAWGSDVFRAGRLETTRNRLVVRSAAAVTGDSSALLARVRELGASPERTFLVNWGIDLELFSPPREERAALRQALDLDPARIVLSARSIRPEYNVDVIVDAFKAVARAVPDARLVVKHPAPDAADASVFRGLEGVRLVGHVPHERMADYFRAADVSVSIPSTDSSPRSVWEAMACGCPCIVSDLPWVRELIEPGRHALVVPVDASAVAEAIQLVLTDGHLAASLASEGRGLVERHRNETTEMDRLASLYAAVARGA